MSILLIITTVVTLYLCLVTGQSPCSTPNGRNGKCVSIHSCKPLLKLTWKRTAADEELLRKSLCDFVDNTPWVCCPSNTCTTPDGAEGTCVGRYSCPLMTSMMQSNSMPTTLEYMERSRCQQPDSSEYSVCCTSQSKERMGRQKCRLTAFPPEPRTECCGFDASGGSNRIVGGTTVAVDEYPWLALIEYKKGNGIKLLCGGVLISGQFVLTAGHCIQGDILRSGTPANVRLGEYDTSNYGADCVRVEGGGLDCNDGAVVVPIKQSIPHPEYNSHSALYRHDIALLRLVRMVEFTDFIRPICLPSTDFTKGPAVNVTLYAAGWGAVSNVQHSSNIKLKVDLPYLPYQDCQSSYNISRRRVTLWDGQICAGGENGKDSCNGDSGGPLMRKNGRLFELVGIVSFGPTPCGMENVAGVYTKVFHYLPWIRSHIVA